MTARQTGKDLSAPVLPIDDRGILVGLGRDGALSVVRSGISNLAFGTDLPGYATDLARRWKDRPRNTTPRH